MPVKIVCARGSSMKKLLCVWELTNEQEKLLKDVAKNQYEIILSTQKTVTKEQAQSAEIIFGNINPDLIKGSPNLRWLQLNSAGADAYLVSGVLPHGINLTNATGAYGQSVAEHMFAMLFMLMKNLHLYRDNQNNSLWKDEGLVATLEGACVLVVGAGDIGKYFARICKSVGAYTIGVKRRFAEKESCFDELYTAEKLDALIPRADVVISILPGTKETDGIWNAMRFSRMKQSAFFINAGRGSAVNQDDLYDALTHHVIKAAGIDVTTPEPLPASSKLWSVKNLMITAHAAGTHHLPATFIRIFKIALENLARFMNGEQLANEVDFLTGYCK